MFPKKRIIFHSSTILFLFVVSCQWVTPRYNLWKATELSKPLPYSQIIEKPYFGPKPESRWDRNVTAILLHTTKGLSAQKFLDASWSNHWNVHLLINQSGQVYGEEFPGSIVFPTSPGIDEVAIHIVLEGETKSILRNKNQILKLKNLLRTFHEKFGIPINNYDASSKKGIYTHLQVKKRFGGFIDLEDHGESQILELIFKELEGDYFPENKWKDRFEKLWVLRKENISAIKKKFQPDRGRGLTPAEKIELKSVEQTYDHYAIESRRIQYSFLGKIEPSCLVLHYTAIPTYEKSISVLEARALNATFLVDKDGKAYQLLDNLYEYPSTAYGTNHKCVQMEIVGKDTDDLLSNQNQIAKVVELTKELSHKFNFPLTNERIESFKGVYSHTQAKKKFGGSIYLTGKDFDPGEPYMELILTQAGGSYFPEKDWYDRQGNNWVILDRNFQP